MTRSDVERLAYAIEAAGSSVAAAVLPPGATPGHDAAGGTVLSLTEAIMGITSGLYAVATAIDGLASAIREWGESP